MNVNEAIQLLESIDPKQELAYEKAIWIYSSINLPLILYSINEENQLFRCRTHRNNNFFHEISDIEIAPKQYVTDFARCNRPCQPIFYCSNNRPTSYLELVEYWAETKNYNEKLYVTIGMWKLKKTLMSIIVTTPDVEKRVTDYDIRHGQYFDKTLNQVDEEKKQMMVTFYKYLFEKFRKPAKNDLKTYIITTAFCNAAFVKAKGRAHAIYYPSVPFNGEGENLAINSDYTTREYLELIHVGRNEFSIFENENKKHTFRESNWIEAKNINLSNHQIEW